MRLRSFSSGSKTERPVLKQLLYSKGVVSHKTEKTKTRPLQYYSDDSFIFLIFPLVVLRQSASEAIFAKHLILGGAIHTTQFHFPVFFTIGRHSTGS
jgi:hypothetical protein